MSRDIRYGYYIFFEHIHRIYLKTTVIFSSEMKKFCFCHVMTSMPSTAEVTWARPLLHTRMIGGLMIAARNGQAWY